MTALGFAVERRAEVDLDVLRAVSARLGADPSLVQANTGNTSVKDGRTMWIKASGTTLADAMEPHAFVAVDVENARHGVAPPRASIETAMHARLPWRVILHVHSLNAVAWAVRADALDYLPQRLAGVNWAWIPYVESGMPLGRAVEEAWRKAGDTNVFILANHGLVVGGTSCEAAEELLLEVERRLALPVRRTSPARLDLIGAVRALPGWTLPDSPRVHALATDRGCRRALRGGVLYPCEAIFFGGAIPLVPATVPLSDALARYASRPAIVFEGAGVVVSRNITRNQSQMLVGLAEIVRRLEAECPLRYLTAAEVGQITGESYLK